MNSLEDNGKKSRKEAEEKAEKEYMEFNKTQRITSDFDKLLLESKKLENKKQNYNFVGLEIILRGRTLVEK